MADKTVIVEIQYDTTEAIKSVEKYTEVVEGAKVEQQRLKSELEKGAISQKDYAIAVEQSKETQSKANSERKTTIQLLGSEKGSINELQAEVKRLTVERNKLDRTTAEGRKGIAEYNNKINDMKTALKGAQSETGKAGGAFATLKENLSNIPGPAGGVISSIGGMTKAALAFVATPVGLVLTAIVGALMLLKKAFMGTEENQNKVTKGLEVLSAMFNTLLSVLRPVAEFLVDKIGKAFQATANLIYGQIKLISKSLEALGFDKAAKSLSGFTEKVRENVRLAKEMADAEARLRDEQRTSEKTMLDYQRQAEKLRQIRDDESNSISDRIAANTALGNVLKKQMSVELAVANTALDVANKRIQIEGKSSENLDRRAEALNKIADIQERITGQESEQLSNSNALRKEQEALMQIELKLRDEILKATLEDEKAQQKAAEDMIKAEAAANEQAAIEDEKRNQDELTRRANAIEALAALKQKELEDAAKSAEDLRALQTEQANSEFETKMLNKQLTDEEIELLEEEHKVRLAEIDTKYNETIRANHENMLQQSFEGMQQIIAATQGMADARVSIVSDAFSKISTINWQEVKGKADGFAQIAQASTGLTNLIISNNAQESADLQARKQYELNLVGDNKTAQEKVLKKFAKKEAELKRRQAIEDKAKAAIDVFISTAVAVAKSIAASPLTVGLPWSAIIGGLGAAQIAAIIAKPLPDFNSGNTFAKGGVIGGKSHAQGGTKFFGEDGSMFEAERGEAMFVLKKDATAEIAALSQLNESKGGRSFNIPGASHLANGGEVSGVNLSQAIKDGMNGVKIVVGVESIEAGMTKYNDVKEAAVI